MWSFLWLRVVSTQLTFGITLYTVTLSGSSGSSLPLAKDIRLCLCFIAVPHWVKGQEQRLHQSQPCWGILCANAMRRLPTDLALSALMWLLSLNSISLCASFFSSIWLLVLTRLVSFRSYKYQIEPLSWQFPFEKVSLFKMTFFHSLSIPWSLENLFFAVIPQHDGTVHHFLMFCFWWGMHSSGHLAEREQTSVVQKVHYVGHLWPRSLLQREGGSSNSLQGTHFFCHPLKLLFWSALLSCLHPSVWFTEMTNESTR